MFRKPKRKNVNQRQTLEDDEKCNDIQKPGVPVETGVSSVKVEEVRRVNTSVLTFDQEEEESGLSFPPSSVTSVGSFGILSNAKSIHKIRKNRDKKRRPIAISDENSARDQGHEEIKPYGRDKSNGGFMSSTKSKIPVYPDEVDNAYAHRLASTSISDDVQERDVRDRFPTSFTDIPDAKAVFEAKKRRELMRTTGAGVQPVIKIRTEDRAEDEGGSRLIREDDENDHSDDENGFTLGTSRIISSKSLLIDAEQQRRSEQLEALKLEQGGSDNEEGIQSDDELNSDVAQRPSTKSSKKREYLDEFGNVIDYQSDEEETERWEREQIRKAVGERRIAEIHKTVSDHRRFNKNPSDIIQEEDMDIEVVPHQNQSNVPSFLNSGNGALKRHYKYENMEQLLNKLENSVISRQEQIRTSHHQIEQYLNNINENEESIRRMAGANIQLERNFQLYQEMKFYIETVLNCLNEKLPMINEIETTIFDLWRTRSGDMARKRNEENRRRFDRRNPYPYPVTWDSEDEESALPESYRETVARLLERSALIFEDTTTEYCDVGTILRRLMDWFQTNPKSFKDAYVAECIPKLIGPFVRIQIFEWNPIYASNKPLHTFEWYRAVLRLGFDGEGFDVEDPVIVGLIPDIVEKVVLPKMTKIVSEIWDPASVTQTRRLYDQIDKFVSLYPTLGRESKFFMKLLNSVRQRTRPPNPPNNEYSAGFNNTEDIQALLAQSKSIIK